MSIAEFFALGWFVFALGAFLLIIHRSISTALIYLLLGIYLAAGLLEMQARPKPIAFEWRSQADAVVEWYELKEAESITVLLGLGIGPRLYVMPWNQEAAEQLAGAGRDAGRGGQIRMRHPFEMSLAKQEPIFYARPPSPPPQKGNGT